jgi:hypothetical protein
LTAWGNTITPAKRCTIREIDMNVLISLFGIRFFIPYQLSFSQQKKLRNLKKYLINFVIKSLRITKKGKRDRLFFE